MERAKTQFEAYSDLGCPTLVLAQKSQKLEYHTEMCMLIGDPKGMRGEIFSTLDSC